MSNYQKQLFLAKFGTKAMIDKHDLINHPSSVVRLAVANRGNKDHLDKLINDPSPAVRMAVARRRNN